MVGGFYGGNWGWDGRVVGGVVELMEGKFFLFFVM